MVGIDGLLTTRQLQELLQVDRITIYRMLKDGRLQGFKVGGQWRFSQRAIEEWLQKQRASLELAVAQEIQDEGQPSAQSLPLSCVQAIQGIFAEALGIGAVTTDVDGIPITPMANSCEFCSLVRGTEAGRERCISSWCTGLQQEQAVPQHATCHAGLHYVSGRIELKGQLVAVIHAGQFLDHAPDGGGPMIAVEDLSATTGLRAQDLKDALMEVPVLDDRRLEQLPRLLSRVAQTFSEIGEERQALVGRLRRIAEMTTYP
jgi:excisionase family DNA binding protein